MMMMWLILIVAAIMPINVLCWERMGNVFLSSFHHHHTQIQTKAQQAQQAQGTLAKIARRTHISSLSSSSRMQHHSTSSVVILTRLAAAAAVACDSECGDTTTAPESINDITNDSKELLLHDVVNDANNNNHSNSNSNSQYNINGTQGTQSEVNQTTPEQQQQQPQEEAVDHELQAAQKILLQQIDDLKESIRKKRSELSDIKEKKFEGGGAEYMKVHAQVKEFLAKRSVEQQTKIKMKKQLFVEQILPVVEQLKAVRSTAPPSTAREESIHQTYDVLLQNLLEVLRNYGYEDPLFNEGMSSGEEVSSQNDTDSRTNLTTAEQIEP